jgi:hypothetical protein
MTKETRHLKLVLPQEKSNVYVLLKKHISTPTLNLHYGKYPLKQRKVKKSLFQNAIMFIKHDLVSFARKFPLPLRGRRCRF